jgi:hypothetical protein
MDAGAAISDLLANSLPSDLILQAKNFPSAKK